VIGGLIAHALEAEEWGGSVKPIRTTADYEAALARIDALAGATPESPEEDELALLADLVDEYEKTFPIDPPDCR
jgi:HTH-type transcriptional regulator / antitoxin HigA